MSQSDPHAFTEDLAHEGGEHGQQFGAIVGSGRRLQVVAGVVLRVGVAGPVAVGNRLRARERVPAVLRQQLVGPALVDVLHTVHGVVLIVHWIGARPAGSRRPHNLGLVAVSIVCHLRLAAKLVREAFGRVS